MSDSSSDKTPSFRHRPARTSVKEDEVASPRGVVFGLSDDDEEQVFKLPARLFEHLPFAVYICDRDGLVLRYNRRAAELWGPKTRRSQRTVLRIVPRR
jgi:PAS domain-containing protein